MQVVVPMSGQGVRFQQAGYTELKPLTLVNGQPMIERLLGVFPKEWPFIFVLANNHEHTPLPALLRRLRPTSKIIYVPQNRLGPWLAIKAATELINPEDPVLITYCDYGMKWSAEDFKKFVTQTECDASILSYKGFHAHYLKPTTYAYSRLEGDLVKEVREKQSFTDNRENEFASCGAYYFKKNKNLIAALDYQKHNNLQVNGEYYTSLTIEALLRMAPHTQCRIYEIDEFYQWGTPDDVQDYNYWALTYQHYQQTPLLSQTSKCSQLMMTMAGVGRRLKNISSLPKPLVPIDGAPMYRRALETLPRAEHTLFVTLNQIQQHMQTLPDERVLAVPDTPHGQALTAELGLHELKNSDVIITSCDHGIIDANNKWDTFIANPQCDAAVFTVTGYPGARRAPHFFSFAKLENTTEAYPKIIKIGLKQHFTESPETEPLVVGSFWFQSQKILATGLEALRKNQKTQDELSLDGIFNCLIAEGLTVRCIPIDGYINWGDTESFKESEYWKKIFTIL